MGGVPYTSDNNGNITSRGNDSLQYDQANRLIQAVANGVTAGYAYDGDGKRAWKQIANGAYQPYTYDIKAATPKLLNDGERRYVWRPGLAYSITNSTDAVESVYHTDGIDSARVLTNAAGVVTDLRRTDAFGVLLSHSGTSTQPFGFAGEQRDDETGLQYHQARYYDPGLGRFISRDPLMQMQTTSLSGNHYVYSLDNPTRYIDPSGLQAAFPSASTPPSKPDMDGPGVVEAAGGVGLMVGGTAMGISGLTAVEASGFAVAAWTTGGAIAIIAGAAAVYDAATGHSLTNALEEELRNATPQIPLGQPDPVPFPSLGSSDGAGQTESSQTVPVELEQDPPDGDPEGEGGDP